MKKMFVIKAEYDKIVNFYSINKRKIDDDLVKYVFILTESEIKRFLYVMEEKLATRFWK
jgi:hypothetical protein